MRLRLALAALLAVVAMAGCKTPSSPPEPTGSGSIPGEIDRVQFQAKRIGPPLEIWFRDHGYAKTLDEAKQAIADAGLGTDPPDVVGGYVYDPAAVEFRICVETPSGAHATYDTKPMSLVVTGASGGCAQDEG